GTLRQGDDPTMTGRTSGIRTWGPAAAIAGAGVVLFLAGGVLGGYPLTVALDILRWIGLAQSWFIFSGFTGYPSLAHSAFFGLGAYMTALLWPGPSLPTLIVTGALVAAAAAWVIGVPILRVRGPYFIILTLGINLFVLYTVSYYDITVRGSMGYLLLGVPAPARIYEVVVILTALCLLTSW